MGHVYLATDLTDDDRVALKTLYASQEPADLRRFEREIRTVQALEHPHIVRFRDVGWEDQLLFFTMDYYPGVTLEEVLEAGEKSGRPASEAELEWYLRLFCQIVDALEYLHARHLIHRDVKPANILLHLPGLEEDSQVPAPEEWIGLGDVVASLADFGLVKSRDDGSLTQTALGTPQYMSPEQIEASAAVDERSDYYSLGVALYRIATGRLPFVKLSDALARKAPPPVRDLNPVAPALLETALSKLLEFEAYRRPASGREVQQLLGAVLAREAETLVASPAPTRIAQPSFCGRSAELRTLKQAAASSARGVGQWVSIVGERGAGKTWLLQRSDLKSHALIENQMSFFAGRFSARKPHLGYQGMIEGLIRHLIRHQGHARAAEIVDGYAPYLRIFMPDLTLEGFGEVDPNLEQRSTDFLKEKIIEAVIALVTSGAEIEPRILALEDLHYGNEFDHELLRRLILAAIPLPILIVTTHRPEYEARQPSLHRLINEFRAEDRVQTLELRPFGSVDAQQMVESMLMPHRPVSRDFTTVLVERTDGIPLYILHFVNSLSKREQIRGEGSQWTVDPDAVRALPIPESTRSHFLLILDDLPPVELKVLNLAAVIGIEFSFEVLLEVSEMEEFELDRVCRNLVHAGILEEQANGFRFLHSFEQEILISRLSRPMQRRLHSRVGGVLEKIYAADLESHLDEIALHLYQGGDQERGREYLLRAGERAATSYAPREALSYFQKAFEFTEPSQLEERRRLLVKIGELHQRLGESTEAFRVFMESLNLFTGTEKLLLREFDECSARELDELRAYAALLLKFGDHHHKSGDFEESLKIYEKAGRIAEFVSDTDMIAFSYSRRGAAHMMREDFEAAQSSYQEAVRLYEDRPHGTGLLPALSGLSRIAVFQGDHDLAYDYTQKALKIAEQNEDRSRTAALLGGLATIERRRGHFQSAVSSLERAISYLDQIGDRHGLALSLGNLGLVHLQRGEFRRAQETFERAREIFEIIGDKMGALQTLGNIGSLKFYQGDFVGAREAQTTYFEEAERRQLKRFIADASALGGLIDLEQGHYEQAEAAISRGYQLFEESGDQSETFMLRVNLARVWARSGRVQEAEAACDEVVGELNSAGLTTEALGEALRVKAEVRLTAGDLDEAEDYANQALKIFEKLSLPYHEGVCARTLAKIYRNMGYYWADQTGKFFTRALRRFEQLGSRHAISVTQLEYGIFLGLMEDLDHARRLLEESKEVFKELSMPLELKRVQAELKELS